MTDLSGYASALDNAAFYIVPEPGYLRLGGNDRVDFLQRQTTNDVTSLDLNNTVMTVLTSSKARILDVFWLVEEGQNIGMITLPGRAASTFEYLRRRIFFNDDVKLKDYSQEYAQLVLQGPKDGDYLSALGCPAVDLFQAEHVEFEGSQIICIGQPGFSGLAFRLLVPVTKLPEFLENLAHAGVPPLDVVEYETLRIEAGFPGEAVELTEDYTPLEVGLLDMAISNTKGCYTGQEVIARQVNFDKITRKLVGMRLHAPVHVDDLVSADGKPAGKVTSVAHSPRFGDIALAVLKRPFDQVATNVTIGDIEAQVIAIPHQ